MAHKELSKIIKTKAQECEAMSIDIHNLSLQTESRISSDISHLMGGYMKWYNYVLVILTDNGCPQDLLQRFRELEDFNIDHFRQFPTSSGSRKWRLRGIYFNIQEQKAILLSFMEYLKAKEKTFLVSIKYEMIENIFELSKKISEAKHIPQTPRLIASGALLRVSLDSAVKEECIRVGVDISKYKKFDARAQQLKKGPSLTNTQFKKVKSAYGRACDPAHAEELSEGEFGEILRDVSSIIEHLKSLSGLD